MNISDSSGINDVLHFAETHL